jgi:hypothetical protein
MMVCLVHLVSFVQPNTRDTPNEPIKLTVYLAGGLLQHPTEDPIAHTAHCQSVSPHIHSANPLDNCVNI